LDGAKLRKKIETDVLRTHKFVLMAHKMQENVEMRYLCRKSVVTSHIAQKPPSVAKQTGVSERKEYFIHFSFLRPFGSKRHLYGVPN
jgi:hypothetical protein